jgi:hypothetical protein
MIKLIAIGSMVLLSHNGMGGWFYDESCCHDLDCYQVADDAIAETAAGYLIKATGEVVPYAGPGGKALDGGVIARKKSKDEHFHRCSREGGRVTAPSICLYVPPGSV